MSEQLPGQVSLEEVLNKKPSIGKLWEDVAKLRLELKERYQSLDKRLSEMSLEVWASPDGQRLQRLADNLFTASLQIEDAMAILTRAQRLK